MDELFAEERTIKLNLPIIKKWFIESTVACNTWILPGKTRMRFDMEDIDLKLTTKLRVNDNGFVIPELLSVDLDLGETVFYHENWLMAVFFDQWIKLTLVIV